MSYERIDTEHTFNCDAAGCNKNASSSADNVRSAWQDVHADGWQNARQGDKWLHVCPRCAEKMGM